MKFTATGNKDAIRLAYALREARQTGLSRELNKGMEAAGKVIADAVTDPVSTAKYLPQGYEPTWNKSVKARVEKRLIQGHRVTVVIWADGRTHRRKIEEINRGNLRHPVFGRRRALKRHWIHKATSQINPWVDQAIKPGLVDIPAAAAMPDAVKKVDDAVQRVVQQIERNG